MVRKIHWKLCAYVRYIVQRGHTFSGNMLKINAQIAKQWFSLVLVGPGKMQKCACTKLHHFCKKGICKNVTEICKNMQGICKNMQKYTQICKNMQKCVRNTQNRNMQKCVRNLPCTFLHISRRQDMQKCCRNVQGCPNYNTKLSTAQNSN